VTPALEITGVTKSYQALRPLRLQSLTVAPGERVAISGVDAGAAEILVNLITGATLPDEGQVRVFGRPTSAITNSEEWLAWLDQFGIVSTRSMLLDAATVEQNLAMPLSLAIDPIPPEIADKVSALARECGVSTPSDEWLKRTTADVPRDVRLRIHLARAVALGPSLLVLEHPTATISAEARPAFADQVIAVTQGRGIGALVITQDDELARRVAHRALRLEPATGVVKPVKRGWFR
jgi:predicted ABC-type transport system involved in lysophospholipase L1 biosynthesis ATPase subunit